MIRSVLIVVSFMSVIVMQTAFAGDDCSFVVDGEVMTLTGDCTTDSTILVPDGFTLEGDGYTITAVDPTGSHFTGAVVTNAGSTAYVNDLTVTAAGLQNTCDVGANRLRGIMFEAASGSITNCDIIGINQGPSGCQEGNAIEIRNAPFDGSHPGTQSVEVAHNNVEAYQKTGIVANGDVDVFMHHNRITASATQENLAANSIQLGYGARGVVEQNTVYGNQWMGTSTYAATAILVYLADTVDIIKNNIRGNSDVGLYVFADGGNYNNNKVFDIGSDHVNFGYDYGIGDWGIDNNFTNNKVRGFDVPYDGVNLGSKKGKNKVIPGPHKFE